MLESIKTENILFLDIETIPQYGKLEEMPNELKKLWEKKAKLINREELSDDEIYQRAGIYAEFGKIICISVGSVNEKSENRTLRIKSFYGDDEKEILMEFLDMVNNYSRRHEVLLCAHNGKEFDFPYIARRMLINGLKLPSCLNYHGKKPWEVPHLDTMEMWKFGDYKHYTSLELLTYIFGIPSPKDDIDGSQVGEIYYSTGDLQGIVHYCEKDLLAIVQLLMKYQGKKLIAEQDIVSVTKFGAADSTEPKNEQ